MSLYKDQKALKPNIEDVAGEIIGAEKLANLMDFVAFLRENKLAPRWQSSNSWKVMHKGKTVCFVKLRDDKGFWSVYFSQFTREKWFLEHEPSLAADDELKDFIWRHIPGRNCPGTRCNGRNADILDREFAGVCWCWPVRIWNADGKDLDCVKKLVLAVKDLIAVAAAADAANKVNPYEPAEGEWLSSADIGAHTGRPLGRTFTESLDIEFTITPRLRYCNAAIVLSGGGWIPETWKQVPVSLRVGETFRFESYQGPAYNWTAVEKLKYRANVTYLAEMSIDIAANTFNSTVWTLDANGEKDTPYRIAVDYQFRLGTGNPAIPRITAIDTVYLGPGYDGAAYVVKDFKIVGGK